VLKWATFLVMDTVRVHTLYPPFGCYQDNKTKRSNEVDKKGVLSSTIDAHLEKIVMVKMLMHSLHLRP
jgi:hypothetical protein